MPRVKEVPYCADRDLSPSNVVEIFGFKVYKNLMRPDEI